MKQKHIPLIATLILALGGCGLFQGYRPPVQQGNVVSSQALAELKPGMSAAQVRFLVGDPLLVSPFDPNRWDYTYYDQPSSGKPTRHHLTLYFSNGRLTRIIKGATPDKMAND